MPDAAQGVQAWDRYAFVSNNPMKYIDPTGHTALRSMSFGEEPPPPEESPDAKLLSLNITAGAGGFFFVAGCDFVVNNDHVGAFSTLSLGPGLGGDTAAIVSREDEDRTFVTPQVGFSGMYGDVFGDSLQTDVSNYQGTSLIGGGSLGIVTSEYFSSVDPRTGKTNNQISGNATGISFGLPSVGGYYYYSRATYNLNFSAWLTNLAHGFKLIP